MDWATFFKDYGQSLFALGGVFLGSAITFLINYLNLRTQAKESDKDRQEQRREAKIQLALELTRDDIRVIEEIVDNTLKSIDLIQTIKLNKAMGKLSNDEMMSEIFSLEVV